MPTFVGSDLGVDEFDRDGIKANLIPIHYETSLFNFSSYRRDNL